MSSRKPFYVRFAARKQDAVVLKANVYGGIGFCREDAKTFGQYTFALWPTENSIFVTSQISTRLRRSRQQVFNPVFSIIHAQPHSPIFTTIHEPEANNCFVFSSLTSTKRETAIFKICSPTIITSPEVIIAEYDAILGQ